MEGASPVETQHRLTGLNTRNLLSPEREGGADREEERRRREIEKKTEIQGDSSVTGDVPLFI